MFAGFFSKWVRSSGHRSFRSSRCLLPQVLGLEDRTLFSTFTVLNLNDSGAGSFRAVIAAANGHAGADIVRFASGLAGTIKLTSGELPITDSVAIEGPGANLLAVSGNNASRIFEVKSGFNVTINGLTISHGYGPDNGGGILNDGSNLTLSEDRLTQNEVYESVTGDGTVYGGALLSLGGTVTIAGCQITGNEALGATSNGGGIDVNAGSASISHSNVSGNLAQGAKSGAGNDVGGSGGGGISGGTGAAFVIKNSAISDNRSAGADNAPTPSGQGAGLATAGPTTVSECTFSGNVVTGGNGGTGPYVGEAEGAAVSVYGPNGGGTGAVNISDSTFDDNRDIAGSGGNSGPGATDPGVDESFGAIFNFGGILTVTGSIFSHNKALGGNNATATGTDIVEVGVAEGGAICNEIGSTATVTSSTFQDNQSIGGNNDKGSGPVVHVGAGFGAGIFSGFGGSAVGANPLTVTNSLFKQNTAQGGNDNTGTASVEGLVGVGVGGAIMNYLGSSATVTASVLIDNLASGGNGNTVTDDSPIKGGGVVLAGIGAGGGIFNALSNYGSSGYGQLDTSAVTAANVFIGFNTAQGGLHSAGLGGGVYIGAASDLSSTSSLVSFNAADGAPGAGGGIYTLGKFTNTGTSIVNNQASNTGNNIDT
jgi:hypothetical protein